MHPSLRLLQEETRVQHLDILDGYNIQESKDMFDMTTYTHTRTHVRKYRTVVQSTVFWSHICYVRTISEDVYRNK